MSVQWHCMSGKVDSHIDTVGPNLPVRRYTDVDQFVI